MTENARSVPGLIWISGFTSAGKSTVARKVRQALNNKDIPSILLDGDNLRDIFGGVFGYRPEQRRELAKAYMRLCSHLSSQGFTVVLAAIALYDEVGKWIEQYIPRHLKVFLDVPNDVRARRDKFNHRNVYEKSLLDSGDYDGPSGNTLTLQNGDGVNIDALANEILLRYLGTEETQSDFGRREHWSTFYKTQEALLKPSPFAKSVAESIGRFDAVVEIGCGNGRDSLFFASRGNAVVAVDPSASAIESCIARSTGDYKIEFLCGDAKTAYGKVGAAADHVYSRFVFHAMPLSEEIKALQYCAKMLKVNGRLHVECRSINDPLARKGEIISPTERIQGHYRRFIIRDELVARVEQAGLRVLTCAESAGWATTENEDPVVIRLEAVKP